MIKNYWLPIIAMVFVPCFIVGCGSKKSGPELYPVTGTVTFQGESIEKGTIYFVSNSGSGGTTAEIISGKYALKAEQGIAAGNYRVEIQARKPSGKKIPGTGPDGLVDEIVQYIPAKYNSKTTLSVEIKPNQNNSFPFEL